jgi:hypothetical protein
MAASNGKLLVGNNDPSPMVLENVVPILEILSVLYSVMDLLNLLEGIFGNNWRLYALRLESSCVPQTPQEFISAKVHGVSLFSEYIPLTLLCL